MALRQWPGPSVASFERQAEASRIVELVAYVGLIAQKLLQGGDVSRIERDSIAAWASCAHDWLHAPESGFDAFRRVSARRGAESFIEPGLRGLQLVPTPMAERIER